MSIIGITMGCPVGIGPEIILRLFTSFHSAGSYSPVIIGDINVLRHNADHFGINLDCITWKPGDKLPDSGIPVYSVSHLEAKDLTWGVPTQETGLAMASYIETATTLVQEKQIDAITTCPITKLALQKAGYDYPGHTEMFAHLTGANNYTMMMAGSKLRVTLVSIHCSFKDIISQLTPQSIFERLKITHLSLLNDFGIAHPRIGVAGLNPHAGEHGIFGDEEKHIIEPAIKSANAEGIDAYGPFPPDTIFFKAIQGNYDAVVCMYHDQGLIPFKLIHFNDGVNVTIGLPVVRTSVDHGTAYDIAGQGTANAESLVAAVKLADMIVRNRKKKSFKTFP